MEGIVLKTSVQNNDVYNDVYDDVYSNAGDISIDQSSKSYI